METEDELASLSSTARFPRALSLIALSIVTIAVAGIAYLQPPMSSPEKLPAFYQLAAVDFVTASTGWVVAELPPHQFAVLHTIDSGETWSRQLAGSAGVVGEYVRFFDPAHGVVVLLGPQAALYQTSNGGGTWSRRALTQDGAYIWSVDFVDADNGWLLRQAPTVGQELSRTVDGGRTWVDLGDPTLLTDWAYRVVFADSSVGWLYSQSAGRYAYKTENGGTTWSRVPLPPPGGSTAPSSTERFFVAPHPTQGLGVMATVIGVAPAQGRSMSGEVLLGYPPLRVGTFDGGGAVTFVYANVSPYRYSSIEYVSSAPLDDAAPPSGELQLSSIDGGLSWKPISTPSPDGAVGYVDARNWWWIGSGAQSTSSDAGRTWSRMRNMDVPEPLPGSLQFIDASHAWFGAIAGTRALLEATADGGVHWSVILLPAIKAE